ncbi:MAG: Mut7-C ubiquitin/RNAse domain-containing protein [Bacteroidales bacterium]|nr:Mut7-C ubiquitin/RNAse domain-containing protein [Bacteroidales bacterium]
MDFDNNTLKKAFTFRFYAGLNDFLPSEKKQKPFVQFFKTPVTVRETIESMGIPLSEVNLVIVNGISSALNKQLRNGDRVAVYPEFEGIDVSPVSKLRKPKPLKHTSFILDSHLGKLAKYLRMLGFDSLYDNNFADEEIILKALKDNRIILTRDKLLLKSPVVMHGYYVRATDKHEQLREIVQKFNLYCQFKSFTRCMTCNSILIQVTKKELPVKPDQQIIATYNKFFFCRQCNKLFWKGSHFIRMEIYIRNLLQA